jgi:hypothetical protein
VQESVGAKPWHSASGCPLPQRQGPSWPRGCSVPCIMRAHSSPVSSKACTTRCVTEPGSRWRLATCRKPGWSPRAPLHRSPLSTDGHHVRDLLGDPHALARAAGVVGPDAVDRARQALKRVREIEAALRQAQRDRDEAIRVAAQANPDLPVAALARELGLNVGSVRRILRER